MTTETKIPTFESILKSIKSESTIKCLTVSIKVDEAALLLKHFNTSNRMLNKSLYEMYANEMLRGKWELNGEPLIFGTDDKGNVTLLTGQHRLHALIKATYLYRCDKNAKTKYPFASLTLDTVLIYGVNCSVADSIDKGKTRSHSDVLFRNEWINNLITPSYKILPAKRNKWCRVLATAARVVWLRAGGATVSSAPKFVISEMLDFIKDKHEKLIDFTNEIMLLTENNNKTIKMPLPYCIGLCYVACLDDDGTVNDEAFAKVMKFISDLLDPNIQKGLTANLHEYWNKLLQVPGSKDRDLEWTGPFIKVLNALLSNKIIKPQQIELTLQEKQAYSKNPILLAGWDTVRYELIAAKRSELIASLKADKSSIQFDIKPPTTTTTKQSSSPLLPSVRWSTPPKTLFLNENHTTSKKPPLTNPVLNRPPKRKT